MELELRLDGLGQVLLTQRTWAMRTFPGCWVFPGGGVDPGEDLATAARRELLEETGLTAEAMDIFCFWESAPSLYLCNKIIFDYIIFIYKLM